eukprot:4272379-Amphidinium_carterae.1
MVNARLFSQLDRRLRAVVPSANACKHDENGYVRPFAGVNVLLLGDFHQLPPPDGGFLADIPHDMRGHTGKTPDPQADYGRDLMWKGAVQGVTELTERERCRDEWWNEVVDELRLGRLSEINWQYMHGAHVEGCRLTDDERLSRRKVITSARDPRLDDPKFKTAKVIVANNDVKYQINKVRAMAYARQSGAVLRWSVAADVAGADVLQSVECDKATKIRWLQYHDRDTGDLCGMLPLAIGMPVALTDHIDRSDKLLLRGCVGHVHSMVWSKTEQQPKMVYVKFDADWKLEGTTKPGIYPIERVKRQWFLDPKRARPVLKVTRRQVPLTPAFAITAHTSQGKTLPAVILDFNVDKRTDATIGTVVASRVRSREDVLILRPFPRWLFNRGAPDGPRLLLQTLRGETVDWEGYRDSKHPMAQCKDCLQAKPLDEFADAQWEGIRANRPGTCLACAKDGKGVLRRKITSTEKFTCVICGFTKIEDAFPRAQLQQEDATSKQMCLACVRRQQRLTCAVCKMEKLTSQYSSSMMTVPTDKVACYACQETARSATSMHDRRGWFTCRHCTEAIWIGNVPSATRAQYCLNCSRRTTWVRDQHTCRSCGVKWVERQTDASKRQRLCPKCQSGRT